MIKIDEEFKSLIPPLSSEEYELLEKSCVEEGIRDALIVWETASGPDILIDGHNRWEISAKHAGLEFQVKKYNFNSREEVKEWIIRNQLGRRNIPPFVRAELALKLKPVIAEKAKENQKSAGGAVPQKSAKAVNTREELAKAAKVSHDTIHKVEVIQQKASEKEKQALRKGDLSINKVYSDIVASEHETRKQKEAEELRKAKHRAEEYQAQEEGKVADFGSAKQHKADNAMIFEEFKEMIRKNRQSILQTSIQMDDEVTMKAIEAADKRELIQLQDVLQTIYRNVLSLQRRIVEVIDEK